MPVCCSAHIVSLSGQIREFFFSLFPLQEAEPDVTDSAPLEIIEVPQEDRRRPRTGSQEGLGDDELMLVLLLALDPSGPRDFLWSPHTSAAPLCFKL